MSNGEESTKNASLKDSSKRVCAAEHVLPTLNKKIEGETVRGEIKGEKTTRRNKNGMKREKEESGYDERG